MPPPLGQHLGGGLHLWASEQAEAGVGIHWDTQSQLRYAGPGYGRGGVPVPV